MQVVELLAKHRAYNTKLVPCVCSHWINIIHAYFSINIDCLFINRSKQIPVFLYTMSFLNGIFSSTLNVYTRSWPKLCLKKTKQIVISHLTQRLTLNPFESLELPQSGIVIFIYILVDNYVPLNYLAQERNRCVLFTIVIFVKLVKTYEKR